MNNKKIPTLIGLVLVLVMVVGLAATTSVVQKVTSLFTQASSSIIPNSVGTANLTDKSFTLYWTTQTSTLGTVSYGKTETMADGIAVDDRNLTSPNEKYLSHFVRISGLTPNTKYFFNISGRDQAPMTITTLGTPPDKAAVDPAFGKINDASGKALAGVIAVLQVNNSSQSATLSKEDGSYVLPAIPQTTGGQTETISFLYGPDTATIACKVSLDRPLPTIKMGDSVDCTKTTTSGATTTTTTSTAGAGFKSAATSQTAASGSLTVNITDNETVSSSLPTISGKAGPNQMVTIEIHSNGVVTGAVQADASGNWTWTPPSNLTAGQHTVTITVTNNDGTKQTITRTFFVSSTSILPVTSGTPSAEVFHMSCVNQACTKITGSGSNSCTTNTDCVPAATVTTPATPSSTTTTTTTPPATGALEDTFMFLGLGLLLIGLGFVPEILQKLSD